MIHSWEDILSSQTSYRVILNPWSFNTLQYRFALLTDNFQFVKKCYNELLIWHSRENTWNLKIMHKYRPQNYFLVLWTFYSVPAASILLQNNSITITTNINHSSVISIDFYSIKSSFNYPLLPNLNFPLNFLNPIFTSFIIHRHQTAQSSTIRNKNYFSKIPPKTSKFYSFDLRK